MRSARQRADPAPGLLARRRGCRSGDREAARAEHESLTDEGRPARGLRRVARRAPPAPPPAGRCPSRDHGEASSGHHGPVTGRLLHRQVVEERAQVVGDHRVPLPPLARKLGRTRASSSAARPALGRRRRARPQARAVDGRHDPSRQRWLAKPHVVHVHAGASRRDCRPASPRGRATRAVARRARRPQLRLARDRGGEGAATAKRGRGFAASRPATGSPELVSAASHAASCSRCAASAATASRASTTRHRWTASRAGAGPYRVARWSHQGPSFTGASLPPMEPAVVRNGIVVSRRDDPNTNDAARGCPSCAERMHVARARERTGPLQGPPGGPGGRPRGHRGRLQAAGAKVPPRRFGGARLRRQDGPDQPGLGTAPGPGPPGGRRPCPHADCGNQRPRGGGGRQGRAPRARPCPCETAHPLPRRSRPPDRESGLAVPGHAGSGRGPFAARAGDPSPPTGRAAGRPRAHRYDTRTMGSGAAGPPPGNPSGSIVTFGRYEGWTLGEVARRDLEYLEWLDRMPIGRTYQAEIDALLRRARAARDAVERRGPQEGLFRRR